MEYHNKKYKTTISEFPDSLTLEKTAGTEWCRIVMETHDNITGSITIRSKGMAEGLRFMLEQLLKP